MHPRNVAEQLNAVAQRHPEPPPVRFVPQAALPAGEAYEAFIARTGCVPTRDNWHDLLNGLVWLRLPRTKQRLNRLQMAEIARDGVGARRGPVRDACTVFDENAALLHAPDALWLALLERRWADLFGPLRPLWAHSRLLVFGHAALEKLLTPYKSITVHVWRVPQPFDPAGDLRELDAWLAQDLRPATLTAPPWRPPVRSADGLGPNGPSQATHALAGGPNGLATALTTALPIGEPIGVPTGVPIGSLHDAPHALPTSSHPTTGTRLGQPGDLQHGEPRSKPHGQPVGKPFAPLPILGVPGWWAGNREPGFYDDATVFRPARR
ncbi:DUF3025 domain-containing protein [Comamonas serinivorans]|uniref:DUF3025 domain-containing protein n=1 Tax=Comamonas serinivorans TaxID=1082851 RepID=UPI001F2B2E11|nr:DUF3025 domain-containing protein [Comamonas serinivorans]